MMVGAPLTARGAFMDNRHRPRCSKCKHGKHSRCQGGFWVLESDTEPTACECRHWWHSDGAHKERMIRQAAMNEVLEVLQWT
jgi:hypothetical protein